MLTRDLSRPLLLCLALIAAAEPASFEPEPKQAAGLTLMVRDDFERDDPGPWEPTDPKAWRITRLDGNRVLDQHAASAYEPRFRSPFNYALAKTGAVRDLVLDLKARSTGRDVPERDLSLIFGYQGPNHFYYAHLAGKTDQVHHNIFVVDGAPRAPIGENRSAGVVWASGWHHVRLVRKVADGLIEVFFDDMTKPVLTAHDTRFPIGRVGIGSFDDTGMFDSVQLWAAPAKRAP